MQKFKHIQKQEKMYPSYNLHSQVIPFFFYTPPNELNPSHHITQYVLVEWMYKWMSLTVMDKKLGT